MMARGTATLRFTPRLLAGALQLTLALTPNTEGQKAAQHEIVTTLETAFDARRQRVIISQSQVNLVKWHCLFVQAVVALLVIAMIHYDNRIASAIALGLFATGCGGVGIANCSPRPAIHRRDLSWARAASSDHVDGSG
jgi:hypothetical protein